MDGGFRGIAHAREIFRSESIKGLGANPAPVLRNPVYQLEDINLKAISSFSANGQVTVGQYPLQALGVVSSSIRTVPGNSLHKHIKVPYQWRTDAVLERYSRNGLASVPVDQSRVAIKRGGL
jgi:hypothetical protein